MKIAVVNNNYQLGGAETVARQVHHGMLAKGHESRLFVSEGKSYPNDPTVAPLYPRALSRLDYTRLRPLVQRIARRHAWTDRAFRRLASSDFDLIHLHAFHGLYASMETLAYVAERKPVVWTFHRFWGVTGGCDHPGGCLRYLDQCGECPRVDEFPLNGIDDTRAQLARKIELLRPLPLHVVSPSRHLGETVKGSRVGDRWGLSVIPNGVDTSAFGYARKRDADFRAGLGLPPDKKIVLVVNRDYKDSTKGFGGIRDALAGMERSDCAIVFAGGNSAYATERSGGGVHAIDYGYVSGRAAMAALYEASDIFLYSSPGENFPCATIEAMSAESCIVTTPTDGVLEQVIDGESGYIAASFEGGALRQKLALALDQPAQTRQIATNARRRAESLFSEQTMVDAYEALFARLIEETAQTRTAARAP